ncbi:unnamed protein product [Caenorhabditis auriculariae]|uniref:Uncharacterized protein n=1 Tax=Caenorhabditis auriculariae TaxID=2777116 RepID=A0A8S1HWC5_9PELO|nr:unnamed protein product [Caenorhabditis auriculariae]
MEFLVDYSFDFNRLFKDGIRYERAPGQEGCRLRKLIREILISPSTLCFHNGFIDLAFIYHHFYLPLPEDFVTYCNNVAELFPADFLPVCDSKFLAVNQTVSAKNVIERRNARFYIDIDFGNNLKPAVQAAIDLVDCSLPVDFSSA